jgi:hypothetical protein
VLKEKQDNPLACITPERLFPDCNRLPWRVKFVPGFTAEASLISYKPDSKVIGVGVGPGIALLPPPHPDRTRQIIPVNTNTRPERLIIRLLDGSFSVGQ